MGKFIDYSASPIRLSKSKRHAVAIVEETSSQSDAISEFEDGCVSTIESEDEYQHSHEDLDEEDTELVRKPHGLATYEGRHEGRGVSRWRYTADDGRSPLRTLERVDYSIYFPKKTRCHPNDISGCDSTTFSTPADPFSSYTPSMFAIGLSDLWGTRSDFRPSNSKAGASGSPQDLPTKAGRGTETPVESEASARHQDQEEETSSMDEPSDTETQRKDSSSHEPASSHLDCSLQPSDEDLSDPPLPEYKEETQTQSHSTPIKSGSKRRSTATTPASSRSSNSYASTSGVFSSGLSRDTMTPQSSPPHVPSTPLLSSPLGNDYQQMLSWIPRDVSCDIAIKMSKKLLEHSMKPSQKKGDYGYIYVFWETPWSAERPTDSLIKAMSPESIPGSHDDSPRVVMNDGQKVSFKEALRRVTHDEKAEAATGTSSTMKKGSGTKDGNILIKIGQTKFVKKRMEDWRKAECKKNLTLLLLYHFHSGSGPIDAPKPRFKATSVARNGKRTSPAKYVGPAPKYKIIGGLSKIPYIQTVERLIHLNLESKHVRIPCRCNSTHREWFEISTGEDDIAKLDRVIRRWIQWAQDEHAK